jgi:creatinine amidohydrolase
MGWMIHDLNVDGAVGNAAAGTAEMGAAIAEHQVAGFIDLIADMRRFNVKTLATEASVQSVKSVSPIKRALG